MPAAGLAGPAGAPARDDPVGSEAADRGAHVSYAPPVDAPVSDPFRPPPRPWLPGNRGIEYATEPGTEVRAAGRGTVTFAGPVAGSLHVTVAHPDGVRTSYSYLASVRVVVGRAVARGTVVGVAGARLHVGARRGEAYIDPASLWAAGPPWVRLVPLVVAGSPLPRLSRRPDPSGPASLTTSQLGPPTVALGRQGRVTSNRWERRSTWISPS